MSSPPPLMIIPYKDVPYDTLEGIVQEFVLREGTEYGEREVPLPEKVSQVLKQISSGDAFVLYDSVSESCDIVSRSSARYRQAKAGDSGTP